MNDEFDDEKEIGEFLDELGYVDKRRDPSCGLTSEIRRETYMFRINLIALMRRIDSVSYSDFKNIYNGLLDMAQRSGFSILRYSNAILDHAFNSFKKPIVC